MVEYLFSLYISLYPYICLKALCENCSFFHYFPKYSYFNKVLKIFLYEILAYLCVFFALFKKIFKQNRKKSLTPLANEVYCISVERQGALQPTPIGAIYCSIKSI